ncbi:hypothetical protein KKG22_01490 [Patescibacteria group bacterium]|nr:hypothetical protein [Patescibacteria group bacterium]MBU1721768.1 hypothetical protein [Patescibacteria group bacterium]MBU1901393.1 hypothetical protein [Patescibacteria group bacterium]
MNKHIHFIGICGVAMSALAIACHKKGWAVTGSDKGFYPPVSTYLKQAGIAYYPGWHPKKMGTPDLVVVGNVAGSKNPEWLTLQEKNIPYLSYPEFIHEYLIKDTSVVCAGTYGKTTSTTLLSWILLYAKKDPSYMFGGIPGNAMDAAHMSDSTVSILEGDEYKTARWDIRPKFAHYSPTHLLLTSVVWDHADIYPTEATYVQAFKNLLDSIPLSGFLVLSEKVRETVSSVAHTETWTYGKKEGNDFKYTNVVQTKDVVSFDILHKEEQYHIEIPMLGEYMADNATGCFAMALRLGIDPEIIIAAMKEFKGLKRRSEKRYEGSITIIDDIAHSPSKAEAILQSIRKVYDGKIITIFEPNTGNRQAESAPLYTDAFAHADEVIIPRLTRIKQDPNKPTAFDGEHLAHVIKKSHPHVLHITKDDDLIQHIKNNTNNGDVVAFLGSHSFRGMIEELIEQMK